METTDGIPSTHQAAEQRASLVNTYAYYTAFVVLGLAAASFGPTLPRLAEHVGSNIGQISYLFVLRSSGYLIGSFLAGRLYDRVPGHRLMVTMILIMAAGLFSVPIIPVMALLALVLLVMNAAEGLLDVGGNTLLVWIHREKMGPYMNGLHFFFGLGAFLSPIIIAQTVLLSGDIYWAYWSLALLMLPAALWLSRLRSPSMPSPTPGSPARPALPVLIVLIALFNFFYVGAEVSYGGWVFTYATTLGLGSQTVAAYLTSGFWGALTVGRLLSIPIAARVSPRTVLLADLLIVIAGLLVILAFPGSFTALWIGTIGVGLGMASIFPTILAVAERHMTITSYVTRWFFVGSSLGGMFLPWVIGQLFEPLGPRVAMLAITANSVLDLIIFSLMMVYVGRINNRQ